MPNPIKAQKAELKRLQAALHQSPNSMAQPQGRNLLPSAVAGSRAGLDTLEAALAFGPGKRHEASRKQFNQTSAQILKRMEKKTLGGSSYRDYLSVAPSRLKNYLYEQTGGSFLFAKGRFGVDKFREDKNQAMHTTAASLKAESKNAYKWEKRVNTIDSITSGLNTTLGVAVKGAHVFAPGYAELGSVVRHGLTTLMHAGNSLLAQKTAREFKSVADQHEETSSFAKTQFFRGKQGMSEARASVLRGKSAAAFLGSVMDVAGTKLSTISSENRLFRQDALSLERWKGVASGRDNESGGESSLYHKASDYALKEAVKSRFKKHVLGMGTRQERLESEAAETLKHLRTESYQNDKEQKAAARIQAVFKGSRQRAQDARTTILSGDKRAAAETFAKNYVANRELEQESRGRETLYAAPAEALYVRHQQQQEVAAAATKIQAVFKGSRQRAQDVRAPIVNGDRRAAAETFAKNYVANRELEQASVGRETLYKRPVEARQALFEHKSDQATKIQAAVRGMQQRNNMDIRTTIRGGAPPKI